MSSEHKIAPVNRDDVLTNSEEVFAFMSGLISEATRRVQDVEYLAYHDELTGVLNRRALEKRIAEIEASGTAGDYAFLVADSDNLKAINDGISYKRGDEILVATTNALSGALRTGDNGRDELFRIGGDEFGALLYIAPQGNNRRTEIPATEAQLGSLRDRISNNLVQLIRDNPDIENLGYGLSVGIARPDDNSTPESLKVAAEKDMKHEKEINHGQQGQYRQ